MGFKCNCGEEAEWHFGDDHYCQLCWEAHCSETWWQQFHCMKCQPVDKPEPQDMVYVNRACPTNCKGNAEPATSLNLDEIMPLLRYKREEAELRNDWRTRYKAYQQQNNKDKANIKPVIERLEKCIAELEARLARSVELTQDEAEILITSFENESMRRYGKVAKDIPLIAKLKARLAGEK